MLNYIATYLVAYLLNRAAAVKVEGIELATSTKLCWPRTPPRCLAST